MFSGEIHTHPKKGKGGIDTFWNNTIEKYKQGPLKMRWESVENAPAEFSYIIEGSSYLLLDP